MITKLQAFSLSLILLSISSDRSDQRGGGSGATRGEKQIEWRKLVERRGGGAVRTDRASAQAANELTNERTTN
jgi:hypothetical protein